jgi:hypothetical protein
MLSELVHASGPCVTLLLPPNRPGGSEEAPATLLKTVLHEATNKLAARRVEESLIDEVLEPLRQLSHEDESLAGANRPRAIFRSPGLLRQFDLPVAPPHVRACTVGGCFWIRPILNSIALPPHIYVLEVTKNAVALLGCSFNAVTAIELPKGIPSTLDEAMGFDQPDHELVNRSSAGPSKGSMPGVKFGTGSGRELKHAHLYDFYRLIDRGLNELLRWNQAPLILTGVDEDIAIYRSINTYSHLSEQAIYGSPGATTTSTRVLRDAHQMALLDVQRRAAIALADAKERFAPGRFSAHVAAILEAAVEGRVSDLYLDENAERIGNFDGRAFGGRTNWHEEDLLNVAAIETLMRSGAVHSLPSHLMADGAAAVASFRY